MSPLVTKEGTMSALVYLRDELGFKLSEWRSLSDADRLWYRCAAEVEMKLLGIAIN